MGTDPRLIAGLIDPRGRKTANRVAMTVPPAVTQGIVVPRAVTTPRPSRPDPSARAGHRGVKIGPRGVKNDPGVTNEAHVSPGGTAP